MFLLYFVVVISWFHVGLSVCPVGWAQRGRLCYNIVGNRSTRSAAASVCRDYGGELITFSNQSDWSYISTLMSATMLESGAWTGLVYGTNGWGFSASATYTELHHWNNTSSGYKSSITNNSYVPAPNANYSQARIVFDGTNTYLMTEQDSRKLAPFCQRDIDTRDACDTSDKWVTFSQGCHKVYPAATWADAVSTCTGLGGQIFSPNKAEDLLPATSLLKTNISFWIGASYKNSGYYFQADNRPVDYLPWLQPGSNYSKPGQTCMAAIRTNSNVGYFMESCNREMTFICQRSVGTCPLGWYRDGTMCFHLHIRPEERMTWFMAVDFCQSRNAAIAQDLSTDANSLLYSVLRENDVSLAWLGFSGSNPPYRDMKGKSVFGNVYQFDTTNTSGGPSRCGVTDFDPRRNGLSFASYCYTPHPFVCTLPVTSNLTQTVAPNLGCDGGDWILFNGVCYKLMMMDATYYGAVESCKDVGGSLVTVNSTMDQSFFSTSPFMDVGVDYYWIGVRYDLETGRYVLQQTGEEAHFWNFDPNQKYNSSYAPCVYVATGRNPAFIGSWFADECGAVHNHLCQKPAQPVVQEIHLPTTLWSPRCGVGWTYRNTTNLCYFISPYVHKPWREARAECQARQGDLLSIDGEDEQMELEDMLKSDIYSGLEESLWIGAADITDDNGWAWSNSQPFRYLHWAEGQPEYNSDDGFNCAYVPVTKYFEWETRLCGDQLGYICRKSASRLKNEKPTALPTPSPPTCHPEPLISGAHSILFPQDFSASSFKDAQHTPDRCRLIPSNNASWSPASDTVGEWLAITFHSLVAFTDIQLRGEDSTDKYVSKFNLQYQYDDWSPWYWVTNVDKSIKIFDGVTAPDATAAIFLTGDILARSIKIWPVEWSYGIAIQLELNGCLEGDCVGEYGMSGPLFVDDRDIRASSEVPGSGFETWNARLKPTKLNQQLTAWRPMQGDQSPWIQVDLGKKKVIKGVTVTGDGMGNYVTEFQIQFSQSPGDQFVTLQEPYGVPYTVSSGIGGGTMMLHTSVEARLVRIIPLKWQGQLSLKFDVLVCLTGCNPDPMVASLPLSQLTASDSAAYHTAARSVLDTQRKGDEADGWQPSRPTVADASYIQADLGTVMQIRAVATQGSESEQSWVTSYYLAFSTDGQTFRRYGGNMTFYTLANAIVAYTDSVIYQGNFDGSTVVKRELAQPVNARYVQLWPHEFHKAISVRWEIYACSKHTASIPLGCYADDESDPDLPFVPLRDQYASIWPEACLSYCFDQGYKFAGLQNGDLCSCGNQYGMYGVAQNCTIPCQDPYSNFTCGGLNENIVFSTGLGANNLVCPSGWTSFKSSCYALIDKDTWPNARNACQKMGAHLVDISTPAENELVASVISNDNYREFATFTVAWTGFNDIRSNLNFEWSSGADVNFTNWGRHQPTVNPGLKQNTVVISTDGSWTNTFMDDINPYICETPAKPSSDAKTNTTEFGCPPEWKAANAKCYRFFRQKGNWSQANAVCASQNTSVARDDNIFDNLAFSTLLVDMVDTYWLDVRDANSTGLFTHNSGLADVRYANWARQKPDSNGTCVSIQSAQHAGEWRNEACQNLNRIVCEQYRRGVYPAIIQPSKTNRPCPVGWQRHGTLCYQFNIKDANLLLNWHEASQNCIEQGAALASFHDNKAFDEVVANFSQDTGNFWIGLNNLETSTGYRWSDGSVVNFIRWAAGQPTTDEPLSVCGEILTDMKAMGLQHCADKRNWICSVQTGKNVSNTAPDEVPQPELSSACRPYGDSWVKYKNYCYSISNGDGDADDALTWRESRKWCQKHGAELASIESADENAFLRGMLNQAVPVEAVWIGLNELDRGSGYSWSDGTPVGTWLLNWNVNEPNDYYGLEGCVEMLARNGKWNDVHCSTRQGFVCKQPAPGVNVTKPSQVIKRDGNCPPGFSQFGYKCYRVLGVNGDLDRLTWADAQTNCRALTPNTNYTLNLASITSQEENAFVTTLLRENKLSAWLGLRRLPTGQFVWADNEDLGFEGWNKNEPNMVLGNDSCAYIFGSAAFVGKWDDTSCADKMAYICQGFVDPGFPPVVVAPSAQCDVTDGFQQFGTSCYKVFNQTLTWQDAKVICSQSQAYLASIMDGYDWAQVYLLSRQYSGVWIGLNDLVTPGVYTWDSGYPVTYTRWSHHQPQYVGSCVFMDSFGLYNHIQCADLRPFVCRKDNGSPQENPTAPGGYCSNKDFSLIGSSCYQIVLTPMTYEMAGRDCELRGATLASIHNSSVSLNIPGFISLWIGLRESAGEGFSWEDQTPVDYTHFTPGQPAWLGDDSIDDSCVAVYNDGYWLVEDCENRNGHVCGVPAVVPENHLTVPPINVTQKTPTLPTILTPSPYSQESPPSPSQKNPSNTPVPNTQKTPPSPSQNVGSTISSSSQQPDTSFQQKGSGSLSGGDIAGIVFGVLAAIASCAAVMFAVKRYGCQKTSFLRREASRVKNFENSLYAETRKDTLTKREHVEEINIVAMESDPRELSVSYSVPHSSQKVSSSGREASGASSEKESSNSYPPAFTLDEISSSDTSNLVTNAYDDIQ